MTTTEALDLFESQLRSSVSRLGVKVLRSPFAIREPGLVIRILPRKPYPLSKSPADRSLSRKALAVSVLLSARVDSDRALKHYLDVADLLIDTSIEMNRLMRAAEAIPDSRIVWATGQDDALYEDPADDTAVWLRDEWRVTLYIP
uniref:Uncharacterized protein n=1 Tax=Gracilinema caldarium TaxID=215591 RepID=A0A7C3IPL4_9SPIR